MGKVYRRKRRSCPLCKPHKTGGAPARTDRERMEQRLAEEEAAYRDLTDRYSEMLEQLARETLEAGD